MKPKQVSLLPFRQVVEAANAGVWRPTEPKVTLSSIAEWTLRFLLHAMLSVFLREIASRLAYSGGSACNKGPYFASVVLPLWIDDRFRQL